MLCFLELEVGHEKKLHILNIHLYFASLKLPSDLPPQLKAFPH